MSEAEICNWDTNLFMVHLGEWKTINPAAWKSGEVKVRDGLQVLCKNHFCNSIDLKES